MFERIRKFFVSFLVVSVLTISSAFAAQTYVICQKKVGIGYGYYNACCSGNNVIMIGFYNSTSQRYMVNNYTGTNSNRYRNVASVYAGKTSNSHYWDVGSAYNSVAHIHHFTTNLIE